MNNLFCWIYPTISIYISIFLWLKTTFSPHWHRKLHLQQDQASLPGRRCCDEGVQTTAFRLPQWSSAWWGYRGNQKMAIFTRGKRWKHVGFEDLYQCTWQKNDDIPWLWPLHTWKQNMISNSRRYTSFIWVAYRKRQQKTRKTPWASFGKPSARWQGQAFHLLQL